MTGDLDWLTYIRTDENTALKQIYTDHRQSCSTWLSQKFGLAGDDAREVFQLSMVILYDNVVSGKLTYLNSNLKTYLYSIAKNQASNLLRKKAKVDQVQIKSMLYDHVIDDESLLSVSDDKIRKVSYHLQAMGDSCKTLLTLYYYEEKSMKDITVIMGYSNANTTKSKKYQCIKKLQSMVQSKQVNLA